MEEIDISTNQLCEQVAQSFKNKVEFDTVLRVWHAVGTVVKAQMVQKKGVRLDKFGVFTFSRSGAPIFNMANDFSVMYRLNQTQTPAMDNISPNKLNLTQLQQVTSKCINVFLSVYRADIMPLTRCSFLTPTLFSIIVAR